MNEAEKVLHRLATLLNTQNDAHLAKELNVSTSTLWNWKARDTVPYKVCVEVAQRKNVSLDWLLTGKVETQQSFTDTSKLFLEQLQKEIEGIKTRLDNIEKEKK